MRSFRSYVAVTLCITGIISGILAFTAPQNAAAAPSVKDGCNDRLLTFPAWYKGLQNAPPDCGIKAPGSGEGDLSKFIWKIALNIIEMVLHLVGYLAVAFIIVGGYRYMLSAGASDGMVKARKTITNAIVGLVISIASVAIVQVIAGAF